MSVDPMDTIVPILVPGHTAAELAASPSPDALPDAVVTSSIPVVDMRSWSCGLTLGQVQDFSKRIVEKADVVRLGGGDAGETYEQIGDTIGDLSSQLDDMLDDATQRPVRSRVQYAVRWADGEEPVQSYPVGTMREARALLRGDRFGGVVVQRTVTTTDWVEVTQ